MRDILLRDVIDHVCTPPPKPPPKPAAPPEALAYAKWVGANHGRHLYYDSQMWAAFEDLAAEAPIFVNTRSAVAVVWSGSGPCCYEALPWLRFDWELGAAELATLGLSEDLLASEAFLNRSGGTHAQFSRSCASIMGRRRLRARGHGARA